MAVKKYLDETGVAYILDMLSNYPDNDVLSALINATQDALDEKAPNTLATTTTPGLMSATDKQVLDKMNPNVVVTLDNMAVEQIDIINAKELNALGFQGVVEPQISTQIRTNNLLNVDEYTSGYYIGSTGSLNTNANDCVGEFIPVTPGQDIYYTGVIGPTNSASVNRRLHVYDSNQTWIKQLNFAANLSVGSSWSTNGVVPSNGAYVRVSWGVNDTNIMITVGTPVKYEPYYLKPFSPLQSITIYNSPDGTLGNADSMTESIPASAGNIYSAKFDPVNGKIYQTSAHIDSYNGETITTRWWSDRDEYAEDTTPTIGAQVVYMLDEEDYVEYDVTPVDLPMFYEENHIWVDKGLITYFSYYAETFASDHITIYNGVTFGNTHIEEQDVINWNNTIQDVSDLYATKADIASPTFTGAPLTTTPGRSDNTTRIATTAFTQNLWNNVTKVETGYKATQNYAVNDLLIMNGVLYSVTTAITSGQTISVGTNVVAVTVDETFVKNTDYASTDNFGIVKAGNGISINNGVLTQNVASSSNVKNGASGYAAITPLHQHESVFYGLATAAGDTTQAQSNNAVGTYTEDAKTAIKTMLGVTGGGGGSSVTVVDCTSESNLTITAQENYRYVCGELQTLSFTPSATGICDIIFTSGSTPTVLTLPNTVKMPGWFSTVLDTYTIYELNFMDGVYGAVATWEVTV